MAQGTIKKLVTDRGFGFILPEGTSASGKDLFFHRADIDSVSYEDLQVGQEVEYDLGTDERRGTPKASHVRPLVHS
jgi:CspA family cold shock protein